MHLKKETARRLFSEFAVIVLGVLVALGVDDWRQFRADRALEDLLLTRLAGELVLDEQDVVEAELNAGQRLWVLDATLAELGDTAARHRLTPLRLDSVTTSIRLDSLRSRLGLAPRQDFDPTRDPLASFRGFWDFDRADDSYQEMLATGALATVHDPVTRASILTYYRLTDDQGANEKRAGEYLLRLEEAWSWVDVTLADAPGLSELAAHASRDPRLPAEMRRAVGRIRLQLRYYARIEAARARLASELLDYAGRR